MARERATTSAVSYTLQVSNVSESLQPKLSRLEGTEWVANRYKGTYRRECVPGRERIVIAPSGSAVALLRDLLAEISSPVLILWVLHTPRSGATPGRYQSPALEVAEASRLLADY